MENKIETENKDKLSLSIIKLENVEFKKLFESEITVNKNYFPCNSSICKLDNGYLVICRMVNYKIDPSSKPHYKSNDPDGVIRTENIAIYYDNNFNIIKYHPIVDTSKYTSERQGLEDYRIFFHNNELLFLASIYNDGTARKVLGKLNPKNHVQLTNFQIINFECKKWGDKNWLPIIYNNKICAIYSYDPLTIFKIKKNGNYKSIIEINHDYDLSTFRGSSGPIIYNNGYLIIIHELVFVGENFNYYHRFIYLNSNFIVEKVSDRFTFMNEDIEFNCGMTLTHNNQKLVITIGIWDREAYFCFLDMGYVESLLKNI